MQGDTQLTCQEDMDNVYRKETEREREGEDATVRPLGFIIAHFSCLVEWFHFALG